MENLIYFEDARTAIAVGLVSRLGVLLYGPGGHAKSRGVDDIMDMWRDGGGICSKQVLSIGTTPLDLVGGGSPEHFQRYIFDRPRVEESWYTQSDVHCFEEFLDLPPRVAAFLKDLMTSRVFRYQNEAIPMRCRLIVGCTNHAPEDIAKQDVSVAALLERFPLQVEVLWPHYTMTDFQAMFRSLDGGAGLPSRHKGRTEFQVPEWGAISKVKPIKLDEKTTMTLAAYLAKAISLGAIVSPRTAVYCQSVLGSYAALLGDTQVTGAHFDILRLVTGLKGVHKDVMASLRQEMMAREQEVQLDDAEDAIGRAEKMVPSDTAKAMRVLRLRLAKVSWVDVNVDRYKAVSKAATDREQVALATMKPKARTMLDIDTSTHVETK